MTGVGVPGSVTSLVVWVQGGTLGAGEASSPFAVFVSIIYCVTGWPEEEGPGLATKRDCGSGAVTVVVLSLFTVTEGAEVTRGERAASGGRPARLHRGVEVFLSPPL